MKTILGAGERWNAPDFSDEEYATRHRRVRAAMTKSGIDVLIVIDPRSIHYLTGYRGKAYQEFQCVFFSLDDKALPAICRVAEVIEYEQQPLIGEVHGFSGNLPVEQMEVFANVLASLKLDGARLGCEYPASFLTYRDYGELQRIFAGRHVVDATKLIPEIKKVKSPAEIAMMRTATKWLDAGMYACVEAAVPGNTEHQVAAAVYHTMLSLGSDVPPSPINIGTGDRTALPHPLPTERVLRAGDFMHVEFAAAYHRYTVSMGRNLCLGKPTAKMREIHDKTLEACDAAIAAVRPGVSSAVPHQAARKVMLDSGWEYGRLHASGYGLGVGFPPNFAEYGFVFDQYPYEPVDLEAGMLITIEPPIFAADLCLGARHIDNVLVTATGAEILSSVPRELLIAG
ncbi:M24 family metallopeptidase [Mesorhizobium sp. CO1-1-8]|uniref:M24 family metallopeptidase n=1 Tax=Mesorhizobium sp. CO1-1-8 TaxID=2876631 RepID=UPI001CD17D31|nr:Xaa-Pro peptidase family protein [Mesorhizobium sp. CO1-1-8]MBZ9772198.1 Xaa-Pro peptidase family protein [Mesorhizobium sp. CO1-1-8]